MKSFVDKIRMVIFLACAHGALIRGRINASDFYMALNWQWLKAHSDITQKDAGMCSDRIWESIGGRGLF